MLQKFKYMIQPKNIAFIGASNNLQKIAGKVLVNLYKTNYQGDIFFVNNKRKEVLEKKAFSSILEIDQDIDLACITTPARFVPEILEECIQKQVKVAMILSAGFSESGPEGSLLEEKIRKIIKNENIIVYGPNTPGFFDYHNKWGISFSPRFEPKQFIPGSVGLISHGGSLARAILDSNEKGIGFSYWFSPGNEADISVNDSLEFLIEDEKTEIILLVMESLFEESRFFELVNRAYEKNKPIILLSIGTTVESIPAVRFHLGKKIKSLFPWDAIRHPGIIKVNSVSEMISLAWLFEYYKTSKGNKTLIFSWTGGASIYLADLCRRFDIQLTDLSETIKKKLKDLIHIKDYYINPLDLTTLVYENVNILTESLDAVIQSDEYDNFIVLFPFQVDYPNEVLAKEILKHSNRKKLFVPIFLSQGYHNELSLELIKQSKMPYFTDEYTAVKSLSMFINYKRSS